MSAVRATFEDVKRVKTRKVWQLIFEVPEENYDAAIATLGGSPQSGTDRWVGIAPVKAPEAPTETERPSTADWSEAKRKMVQRSGIVRKETAFHEFLAAEYTDLWHYSEETTWKAAATDIIHQLCFVDTCRDLEPGERSGHSFAELMRQYDSYRAGQTPEAQEQQLNEGRR